MKVANETLYKIGLNLNASKTKFLTMYEISKINLHKMLDEKKYDASFNSFYKIYSKNKNIRYDTYLKRILGKDIGIDKFNNEIKLNIKSLLLDDNFLICCNYRTLLKIYQNLNNEERIQYLNTLNQMKKAIKFNCLEYNIEKLNDKIQKY